MKHFNILRNEAGDDTAGGGSSGASDAGVSLIGGAAQTQAAPAATGATSTTPGSGPFDFRSLIGDDGNFTPDFRTKLPEEWKGLDKFANPKQLFEGYSNLQQLLGKKADAVVIPAADASKEDWAPVLKKLGVPDSPDGYGLKVPEKLPDGVQVDEAELKEFAQYAHSLGLTPQQVAKLQEYDLGRAGKYAASAAAQTEAFEVAEFQKQSEELAKAWGNGPEATQKKALAERAALTFGFTPEEVGKDPLFRNARFVMTLARAGAAMSEDSLVKAADVNSSGSMKAKAQDVISNPSNPLYKRYWDGDPEANAQVQAWMKAG